MSSLSTSSSSRIDLFVLCSRHETPSIFRQHHISKASILFLSDFLIVHPSAPCRNTAHTICFMILTFSTLLMLLSFQILVSSVAFYNYMAMIYHCRLKAYYCIDFLGRKIYLSGTSPIRTKFGIHGHVKGWQRSGKFGHDRPILDKMGAETSPAKRKFYLFGKPHDFSATRNGRFSPNLTTKRTSVSRRWIQKDIFRFTLWVICPQNLKSKVGHTGTSLRAGYMSRDALQRDIIYVTL